MRRRGGPVQLLSLFMTGDTSLTGCPESLQNSPEFNHHIRCVKMDGVTATTPAGLRTGFGFTVSAISGFLV